MQVTSSSIAAASLLNGQNNSPVPQKVLNQDDFLKLLIAQMTSQDPMKPVSNTDFVAQMAQFTSLEQSRSMGSNISALLTQQEILQANGMIGRDVALQREDETIVQGTVSAVQIVEGTPMIIVNGESYNLNQVLTIAPAATTTT
jgi:flagellar basal-body rod modification protein FlgD